MQTVPPQPHGLRVPLLGQQPNQEQVAKTQISQAISGMSMTMYQQLATAYIARLDEHQEFDVDRLREMASRCHLAAKAYFEGLGIIEFKQD